MDCITRILDFHRILKDEYRRKIKKAAASI